MAEPWAEWKIWNPTITGYMDTKNNICANAYNTILSLKNFIL